jgi:hypothetical protein
MLQDAVSVQGSVGAVLKCVMVRAIVPLRLNRTGFFKITKWATSGIGCTTVLISIEGNPTSKTTTSPGENVAAL